MTTRRVRLVHASGFTLVELLVASLMTLVIAGTVLSLARLAQRTFQAQPELSDLQQRARITVDSLRQDLLMAGAGTFTGPALGPLHRFLAPVMPYHAFGNTPDPARGIFFRNDAISILFIQSAAQSTLSAVLPAGALDVSIAAMPGCPMATGSQTCGFASGDRVMVFAEDGRLDVFNVDQIATNVATLQHHGTPAPAYDIGASIAAVTLATYHLKVDPSTGASQLFRFDGWASDQPVVDDVAALTFDYFGEAEPPRLIAPVETVPGPWTTYGPKPPRIGEVRSMWPAGENCAFRVDNGAHVPRLPTLASGVPLVALTPAQLTDGPWCPDDAAPNRFDADLLRVRRIHVTLRMRSSLSSLRGPGNVLLTKGAAGQAPDLDVQFDVAPRNLLLGW